MNLETLFEKTRILISDLKYNSNKNRSDSFNSDEDLIGYYQMALNHFDNKTMYTRGSYDVNLSLNVTAGQNVYKLPGNILKIDSATFNGQSICPFIYLGEEPFGNTAGFPFSFQLDYQYMSIRLFPTPHTSGSLKIRGVISTEVFDLSDLSNELPLPQKYHEYFKYFIASKCLEKIDGDFGDSNKSQEFMAKFELFCRDVRLEVLRLTHNTIIMHNGSYNS